jgi:hypothetical protein
MPGLAATAKGRHVIVQTYSRQAFDKRNPPSMRLVRSARRQNHAAWRPSLAWNLYIAQFRPNDVCGIECFRPLNPR